MPVKPCKPLIPERIESASGDTDEVITALAKTVADLTCSQNGTVRQQIIEPLMREIMEYDAEFRREDASGAVTSVARH
jgi:hypothetical protein